MGFYEFFFPAQAQAEHLGTIARSQRAATVRSIRGLAGDKARLGELEKDVGYIALLLGSILQQLDTKGLVTREEVKQALSALDQVDGVKDGRLDVNVIRGFQT